MLKLFCTLNLFRVLIFLYAERLMLMYAGRLMYAERLIYAEFLMYPERLLYAYLHQLRFITDQDL